MVLAQHIFHWAKDVSVSWNLAYLSVQSWEMTNASGCPQFCWDILGLLFFIGCHLLSIWLLLVPQSDLCRHSWNTLTNFRHTCGKRRGEGREGERICDCHSVSGLQRIALLSGWPPAFMWLLEVKFRSPGLRSKCFYLLSHLATLWSLLTKF